MPRNEIIAHKIWILQEFLKNNNIKLDFDYCEKWGVEVTVETLNATETGLSTHEVFGS